MISIWIVKLRLNKFLRKDRFKKIILILEDQKILRKVIKDRKNKRRKIYLVFPQNNWKKKKLVSKV